MVDASFPFRNRRRNRHVDVEAFNEVTFKGFERGRTLHLLRPGNQRPLGRGSRTSETGGFIVVYGEYCGLYYIIYIYMDGYCGL